MKNQINTIVLRSPLTEVNKGEFTDYDSKLGENFKVNSNYLVNSILANVQRTSRRQLSSL